MFLVYAYIQFRRAGFGRQGAPNLKQFPVLAKDKKIEGNKISELLNQS